MEDIRIKKVRLEILKEIIRNKRLRRALEDYYEFESPSSIYRLIKNKPQRLTEENALCLIQAYLQKEKEEIIEEDVAFKL